jgi:hypothetical protein
MRSKALTCAVVVLCCFAWSFAVQTAYLPQVANGTSAGVLSVRTTFIVFNNTTQSDTVTIRLTGNSGTAMTVTIPGLGTHSEFTFSIASGETKVLQTDGSGAITAGAARVESQRPLGVSAIFTMYNGTGGFLTQAGVGSSPALKNFVIPVDVSTGFNTGVALFAPASSTITFTLRKSDGTVAGTTSTTLGANNHLAKFVAGGDGLFPSVSGFTKGTLEGSCTTVVAGVVLRQSTNLANTTLPVIDKTSTQTAFNLPQIANGGEAAGTNIRTTFIIFNISPSDANVTITVRKPDSTAFPVTVADMDPPSFSMAEPDISTEQSGTLTRTLKPGASAFLQTTGTGSISVGSATVASNVPIGVSAIFTLYNGQTFMTEAGVGDSPISNDFTLPVNYTANSSNGVAFFNPHGTSASINVWLIDESGASVTGIGTPILLPAWSQSAKLVSELFPGKTSFRGSMGISVTQGDGVAAVTLLTNNNPLSYTTLPVVEGSFLVSSSGSLLDLEKTGIGATSNTTVNATLPGGFKISGTIGGSFGTVSTVTARSTASGGKTYTGLANNDTKKYVVVVPAGTYELAVCYMPESLIPLGVPTLNYTVSPTFSVSADTTKNITIPAVTLNPVMGTVTGIDALGAPAGMLSLTSADWKTGVTAMVLPVVGFTGQLPAGTYTASLSLAGLTGGQSLLGFYNVGTLTVSGSGTGAFAVPATVQVSGTVTGGSANSMITVSDTSVTAPAQTATACAAPTSTSMTTAGTGGAYQLLVPKSRPLSAQVQFTVGSGTVPDGLGMFPWPVVNLGTLSANKTQNFNIPALPGLVTISGKVTNGQGQGVVGVAVGAMSTQITGASGVYYAAGAETDSNGNYTMKVLNGTNYTMTFQPPMPTP